MTEQTVTNGVMAAAVPADAAGRVAATREGERSLPARPKGGVLAAWGWLVFFLLLVIATIGIGSKYDGKTLLREALPWTFFALSLLPAIIVLIAVGQKRWAIMGLPSWDFSSSWATNITVTGVLAAIPILSSIPATNETSMMMPRMGYVGLTMTFLVLAATAPLVYNLSRTPRRGSTPGAPIVAQGRAYMFIAAGAVTTLAAAGQILIVAALVEELRRGDYVSDFVFVIEAILMIVGLWLFVYAPRTMYKTIELLPDTEAGLRDGADRPPAWPLL